MIAVIAAGSVIVASIALFVAVNYWCDDGGGSNVSNEVAPAANLRATTLKSRLCLSSDEGCCCALRLAPKAHFVSLLESIDLFSMRSPKKRGDATISLPTALGGLCTVAGVVTICCLALVSIIRRNEDNILSVSSLSVLDPVTLRDDLLVALTPSAPASLMAGAAWTGVRIRIVSALPSAPGAVPICASLASIPDAFSFGGLVSGAWRNASVANCGDGTAALVLTCPDCVFSSTSSLTLALPYQCQSLVVDAAAVSATGALSTASIAVSATSARSNALLKNVTWSLAPVLDMLDDQVVAARGRGLRLISLSQSSVYAPSATAGTANITILPASASITFTFLTPLQGYYSLTVASEKVTALQLLASVIGLVGLLGAFRILHTLVRRAKSAPIAAAAILRLRFIGKAAGGRAPTTGVASMRRSRFSIVVTPPAIHVPHKSDTLRAESHGMATATTNPINTACSPLTMQSRSALTPQPTTTLVDASLPQPEQGLLQLLNREQHQQLLRQHALEQQHMQLQRQHELQGEQMQTLERTLQQLLALMPNGSRPALAALPLPLPNATVPTPTFSHEARGLRAQAIALVSPLPPAPPTLPAAALQQPSFEMTTAAPLGAPAGGNF